MTVPAVVFVGSRRAYRADCTGDPAARACINHPPGWPWLLGARAAMPDRAFWQRVSDLGSTGRTGSRIAGRRAADAKTALQNPVTRPKPPRRRHGPGLEGAILASRSAAGASGERG